MADPLNPLITNEELAAAMSFDVSIQAIRGWYRALFGKTPTVGQA
jgi:hypothetical protein